MTISTNSGARRALLISLLLLLAGTWVQGQTPQPIESGKFRLHKFEQPIGEENYTVTRDGDSLVISSNFQFTDRGRSVPLAATLQTRQDLTPLSFNIKGSVSRFSTIDSSVEVGDKSATVREDTVTRQASLPDRFFAISGYAPVTMQQMLVRYLNNHKIKGGLATLPGGNVT